MSLTSVLARPMTNHVMSLAKAEAAQPCDCLRFCTWRDGLVQSSKTTISMLSNLRAAGAAYLYLYLSRLITNTHLTISTISLLRSFW